MRRILLASAVMLASSSAHAGLVEIYRNAPGLWEYSVGLPDMPQLAGLQGLGGIPGLKPQRSCVVKEKVAGLRFMEEEGWMDKDLNLREQINTNCYQETEKRGRQVTTDVYCNDAKHSTVNATILDEESVDFTQTAANVDCVMKGTMRGSHIQATQDCAGTHLETTYDIVYENNRIDGTIRTGKGMPPMTFSGKRLGDC